MGVLCSKLQKKSNKYSSTTTTPSSPLSKKSEVNRSLSDASVTVTSIFPLLKLPSLAIDEVLKEMDILAQIQLSSVSIETKEIVQSFAKRNAYKLDASFYYTGLHHNQANQLELRFGKNGSIRFKIETLDEKPLEYVYSSCTLKLDGIVVPATLNFRKDTITTYWTDKKAAVENLLLYFYTIFNPMLSINFHDNRTTSYEVIDLIESKKWKINKVSIDIFTNYDYYRLLKLPIGKLDINIIPSKYSCRELLDEPMKFDELHISYAAWVNLEDFLHCKNISIILTSLNNKELNVFLKKWMTSESQLRSLELGMDNPNLKSIVEGLSVTPLRRAWVDKKFQEFKDGNCFGVQKSDGEKAIVYATGNTIILKIASY